MRLEKQAGGKSTQPNFWCVHDTDSVLQLGKKNENDLSVRKDSCNAGMVYAKRTREEEKIEQLQGGLIDEMIAVKEHQKCQHVWVMTYYRTSKFSKRYLLIYE